MSAPIAIVETQSDQSMSLNVERWTSPWRNRRSGGMPSSSRSTPAGVLRSPRWKPHTNAPSADTEAAKRSGHVRTPPSGSSAGSILCNSI